MQTLMWSSSISFEVNSLGNNFCRAFLVEEVNWKSAAFIAASCFLVKLSRSDNKRVSEKDKCLPCFAVSSISLTASRNSFLEVKVTHCLRHCFIAHTWMFTVSPEKILACISPNFHLLGQLRILSYDALPLQTSFQNTLKLCYFLTIIR